MNVLVINENVLNLGTRRNIFETIKKQPGICIRELERTLKLAIGELTYHLPILLNANLIQEERDGYFRRFFPLDINDKEKNIISALRSDAVKKVVPLLLSKERVTQKDVSEALSISISTAKWHLDRLEKNSLVERKKKGKTIYFSLKDKEAVKKIYLL